MSNETAVQASKPEPVKHSQAQMVGASPLRTWEDYSQACINTYGGGHHSDGCLDAFRHGMATVFNLLQKEFPPAEQCKAAPELLAALEDAALRCTQARIASTIFSKKAQQADFLRGELNRIEAVLSAAIAKARGLSR